jgi:hypothetical protein
VPPRWFANAATSFAFSNAYDAGFTFQPIVAGGAELAVLTVVTDLKLGDSWSRAVVAPIEEREHDPDERMTRPQPMPALTSLPPRRVDQRTGGGSGHTEPRARR